MLKSKRVPQADILDDVINTVQYVDRHPKCSDKKIAKFIGKVDRQGRYYRHAAVLLGLINNYQNEAWITNEGTHFLTLSKQEQEEYLRNKISNIEVFELAIDYIKNNPGCTVYDIEGLLVREGIVKLAERRSKTVVAWLIDLGIVRLNGESLSIR